MLAERVLDQRRLVGAFGPEDLAEACGLGFDAVLATGLFERGLDLGAGRPCGPRRGRGAEELAGFGPAQAVGPGGEGGQGDGVVLAQ